MTRPNRPRGTSVEEIASRIANLEHVIEALDSEKMFRSDIDRMRTAIENRIKRLLRQCDSDTRKKVRILIKGLRIKLLPLEITDNPREEVQEIKSDKKINVPRDVVAKLTKKEFAILQIMVGDLSLGGEGVKLLDIDRRTHKKRSRGKANPMGRTRMLISFLNEKIKGWGNVSANGDGEACYKLYLDAEQF